MYITTTCFLLVLLQSYMCVSSADTTTLVICGSKSCAPGEVCENDGGTASCKKGEGAECLIPTVTTTTTLASTTLTKGTPGPSGPGTAQTTLPQTTQGVKVETTTVTEVPSTTDANSSPSSGRRRREAHGECIVNADCVTETLSPICRCKAGFKADATHNCQQDSGAESAKASFILASAMMLMVFFKLNM